MDKLCVIPGIYPGNADPHINFSGGQIFRLGLFQRSHVISKGRITLRSRPRSGQLFADVA